MSIRTIELTQGNINNHHLYLTKIIDFFPKASIGGANETDSGALLNIDFGGVEPVLTDIAGDKKIFRKRSWVRVFFKSNQLKAGSKVVIEKTGETSYRVFAKRD